MNTKWVPLTLVAALAFAAGLAVSAQITPSRATPDPLDAVVAAPKNHKVLYEDDHVRILEVTSLPGETESMHTHPLPSVIAYDAVQPTTRVITANGTRLRFGRNLEMLEGAGQLPVAAQEAAKQEHLQLEAAMEKGVLAAAVRAPQTIAHQITNTDTFPLHIYRIEFKRVDGNEIMKRSSY